MEVVKFPELGQAHEVPEPGVDPLEVRRVHSLHSSCDSPRSRIPVLRRWWHRQDEELWLGLVAGGPGAIWVFAGPIYIGVWGEPGWNWQNLLIIGPWAAMGIAVIVGGIVCLIWYLSVLAWQFCRGGWKSLN